MDKSCFVVDAAWCLVQNDVAAKVAISRLKRKFQTSAEALLHGDLHTGAHGAVLKAVCVHGVVHGAVLTAVCVHEDGVHGAQVKSANRTHMIPHLPCAGSLMVTQEITQVCGWGGGGGRTLCSGTCD